MNRGFSRQDKLIKRLKNCLGTLPDQQPTKQKSHLLNISNERQYLQQQIKQEHYHKGKERKFLQDMKEQLPWNLKEQKKEKRQQLFLQDKHKKRNQYYKQRDHLLADITNLQYSTRKVRNQDQAQCNFSKRKGDSNYKNTYDHCYDQKYQQKARESQRTYLNAGIDPLNLERNKYAPRKNSINQYMKLQLTNDKQNIENKYKSSRARPLDYEFYQEQKKQQSSKQPIRLNNNIGSIRRKRRESGKISENILDDTDYELSQSNISIKKEFRSKQDKTMEGQLKNYFCKNCGSTDNKVIEKAQIGNKVSNNINRQDIQNTEEKLKKISQLNQRINQKISNIVETFQKSTEALYTKLYSKE